MKRYASHFLFLQEYGYLKRQVVEMEEGAIARIFPLTEEVENTEWLPGVMALLTSEDAAIPEFGKHRKLLDAVPLEIADRLSSLTPVLFFPFDFTTMLPVAGTRRRPLR